MTEQGDANLRGWVCFDAHCPWCRRWARRGQPWLARHGYRLLPLQSPLALSLLNLPREELLREMRVVETSGAVFGGADALIHLASAGALTRHIARPARIPAVRALLRLLYRHIARRRPCDNGQCELPIHRSASGLEGQKAFRPWLDWIPFCAVTASAVLAGGWMPPWAHMWLICFAMFAGCKWISFRNAVREGIRPRWLRIAGYFLAWPGMDASAFLRPGGSRVTRPAPREWTWAATKVLGGALLTWVAARHVVASSAALAGWTGMIGLILVLHFGLFECAALAWRGAGVHVLPLMRAPIRSESLSEFWGRRWNTGFHRLAFDFAYRPLRAKLGPIGATFVVFAISGLIHELAISVPAGGGWALPTGYFLLQGTAVVLERSRFGRRRGAGRGNGGRLWTLIVAAGPVFWLFHPPFVHNVMVPFLKAIHAL